MSKYWQLNAIDKRNVFMNKGISEIISEGRNAFLCYVMQTNQGPDRLCQLKSHAQTACESHDLNMTSNSFV